VQRGIYLRWKGSICENLKNSGGFNGKETEGGRVVGAKKGEGEAYGKVALLEIYTSMTITS
jgi:hypothetical protein